MEVGGMDYQQMRREIDTTGYTIVRGLLTPDEVDYYISRMEAVSGITRSGMMQGGEAWKGTGRGSGGSSWTLPDGLVKSRHFWPVVGCSLPPHYFLARTTRHVSGVCAGMMREY